MDYKDYYKILDVDRKASAEEIKKSYRNLAMKYHPDRNPGDNVAEEKFKEINEAYQVLGNDEQRARYDQLGSSYSQWQQKGAPGNFNWDDWFVQNSGGAGGVRVDMGDLGDIFGGGGVGGSFSDFFNMIFGGGGNARTQTRRVYTQQQQSPRSTARAKASEHPVRISLAEAFAGTERTVQVDGKRLQVKIPAGAKTGTKVRMANAGPANPFGQKSDLYLVVEVTSDQDYERKGDDLYTQGSVDLFTAVLGGQLKVKTLSGDVILTVPPGTQPGQNFRLSGRGMPKLRSSKTHGDLYVQIKVNLPKNLSKEQRELFEKLRSS